MNGIIGLKNIFGRPVRSDAIYFISFYKSLNGLSRIKDFIGLFDFEVYTRAVDAPIDLPHKAI
jgi:hypothetical protein